MWKVEGKHLLPVFRDGIGERWTAFLDALLRALAAVCSVPDREIITNQRVNLGDAGVDSQVNAAFPGEPTDRLATPTCWQYKAEAYRGYTPSTRNKKLAGEINKSYAVELIQKGFAYRFCICDCLPAATRAKWETRLKAEKDRLNPQAPDPLVVAADDIAAWASRFPGLLRQFFHPELREVHDLETWGASARQTTKTYVPVASWQPVQEAVVRHATFSLPCHDVGLSLQGEAGVGKTRSTYESISAVPGASGLVLYTADEQLALRVARLLLNDQQAHAILVADECQIAARVHLEDQLRGIRGRVRLVTITNSGVRPAAGTPEYWLTRLDREPMLEILRQNFSSIPEDRRALYADLAGGFVRLAIQLCHDHPLIERHGLMAGATYRLQEYLQLVIGSDAARQDVVDALSLVRRVGYRDEVAAELDALCDLLGLDRGRIQKTAFGLKDVPGFVAQAGRYLYLTPAIIATTAFQTAWQRWVAPDPAGFFRRIPAVLFESFQERVAESATPEIRKAVSDFFLQWMSNLRPEDLAQPELARQVAQVVETYPDRNLPLLRALIEASSLDQLRAVTAQSLCRDWGPRRQLVWLAERLVRFAEYFPDGERILRRLALAESEPRIGNNATRIWQQLFRVYLSGTSVPFAERLSPLEHHLRSKDPVTVELAVGALMEVFDTHPMRMAGRPLVAGRIAPPDWQPSSPREQRRCYEAAFDVLCRIAADEDQALALRVREFLIQHLSAFLAQGWLDKLKDVLAPACLPVPLIPAAIEHVEEYLSFERGANGDTVSKQGEYLGRVRAWAEELRPKDFGHRLVALVGRNPWLTSLREETTAWQSHVAALAQEIISAPDKLGEHLPWLGSPDARGAGLLGQYLGRLDREASFLDLILLAAESSKSTALARGYVLGLLEANPAAAEVVNQKLDRLQTRAPQAAYELIVAAGDAVRALPRLLQLVDTGRLPATHLRGIAFGLGGRKLSRDELLSVLQRCLQAGRDDPKTLEAALDILGLETHDLGDGHAKELFAPGLLRKAALQVLKASVDNPGREQHAWFETAKALEQARTADVIPLVALGLVSKDARLREGAQKHLAERAGKIPREILAALEKIMKDKKRRHYLFLDKYVDLVGALPVSAVAEWLKRVDVQGARCLARHLPLPFIDEEGNPRVPEVTAYVLEAFENDQLTFEAFCSGAGTRDFYWVEGGKKRDRDAEVAERFLDHPLRRIRQWAKAESQAARAEATQQRLEDEEEKALL
jgi:hypothetical protein